MCFSAVASFSASAFLTGVGLLGMHFALRYSPRFIALNLISFFYAIQQFSEGMVWLNQQPRFWALLFLFFAFFVYPWYTGFACYCITRRRKLRAKILWVTAAGFLFGAWAFVSIVGWLPQFSVAQCHAHIFYDFRIMGRYPVDGLLMYSVLIPLYVLLTSLPCFLSDRRYTTHLAWIIVLNAVFCIWIYTRSFVSVWCFYAAIISGAITLLTYMQWRVVRYPRFR